MAIPDIRTEEDFKALLHKNVSASAPIKSIEHLRGREKQSQRIARALSSPGRSVFIYGDRGVGKTSLALTSAYRFPGAANDPEMISVDSSSTFFSIIHDLVSKVAGQKPGLIKEIQKSSGAARYGGLSVAVAKQIETGTIPEPTSINEAVMLVEFFYPDESAETVVVIDELERLSEDVDRALFADFIKQIGDRELNLKIIFCGVADSLDELLAAHHSCYRYLETVELERLDWNARAEIVKSAAEALGVEVSEIITWRISAISDGFPYYVHIVCEKMFWAMYDADELVTTCSEETFEQAVNEAVSSIEPVLKKSYDAATRKYNDDYQEVLWAAANHNNLERRNSEMYTSYLNVMVDRENPIMDRKQFSNRLNALKKPPHGEILVGTRTGWYRFQENVVRGYVRLRAVQQGVQLHDPKKSEEVLHQKRSKELELKMSGDLPQDSW